MQSNNDRELKKFQLKIGNAPPEMMMSFFTGLFGGACAFSTSLGAEDQVITHMIASEKLDIRIFTLDTGRLFQETYDLIGITEDKYGIKIETYFPEASDVEKMVNSKGINLFYDSVPNRQECCRIRKSMPLGRALKGMKLWITGLRQEQSPFRKKIEGIGFDETYKILKLNPLYNWKQEQVWDYIREHKIPFNPLHDKGYASIGCLPCTRALIPGEDFRAGRWWWEEGSKKECGIHINDKKS